MKFNFNLEKFGNWTWNFVKSNSSTIIGGLSMIGLAMLCKKLDIPYQVLTDPYYKVSTRSDRHDNYPAPTFYLMPNNPGEAAIASIIDSAVKYDLDYKKVDAAKQILNIVKSKKEADDCDASLVTYAITALQRLTDSMDFDYQKESVLRIIAALGKGDF